MVAMATISMDITMATSMAIIKAMVTKQSSTTADHNTFLYIFTEDMYRDEVPLLHCYFKQLHPAVRCLNETFHTCT